MGDEQVYLLDDDDTLDDIKGHIIGFKWGKIEIDGEFTPAELRRIADAFERAFAAPPSTQGEESK